MSNEGFNSYMSREIVMLMKYLSQQVLKIYRQSGFMQGLGFPWLEKL